ncbi:MAG: orotate phosphoribosyltransferase [Phycisphaerales bacterium]|nr:orotate phosphoribosyltransferase [Phycisphaerales bacterium]MCB9835811.1 orotate phosphoribosyltransferase [Phycisphaera sp.]
MSQTLPDRAALARQIADLSLLRGTFTLRSGRTSSYYLDKYLFSTRPEVLSQIGKLLGEAIGRVERETGQKADRLAGAELGGIPLVTAASLVTGKPCVFIRNQKKDYGTARQLEGKLEKGERVIIVEDVATTAGQTIEACKTLEAEGATVLAAVVVIDRQEGASENMAEAGYRMERLFTKADLGVDD